MFRGGRGGLGTYGVACPGLLIVPDVVLASQLVVRDRDNQRTSTLVLSDQRIVMPGLTSAPA
jgi:hypothetical protein